VATVTIVETHNLTKKYGHLVAVNNLNLRLEEGDVLGFIGPNGAGKTTTIRILATLLEPTSGTATIAGHDVLKEPEAVRRVIGYMPDFFGVYDDVKVWEYLDFFACAYRVPRSERGKLIDDVLALTDLSHKKNDYVEALSRGMKQRLCLAKTLLHNPQVLLLDEPASGLDPRARIEIKELLKELQSMGKTILISSHILPELADICNKIAIIERGELLISGEINAIMRQLTGSHVLEIRVADDIDTAVQVLQSQMEDIREVQVEDGTIRAYYIGPPGEHYRVMWALAERRVKVLSFAEQPTDLEDIFMRVTQGAVQ
jgi:ABC-2 type transport system ATP-binding protein